MKKFLSSILTAVPLVLAVAGLAFGQTAATATWALSSDTTVAVSGSVNAMGESISGLQAAYETPPAGTTNQVQKLKPDSATSGTSGTGSWPTETSPNSARYVQFAVGPQTSFNLTVNSISMMIGNKGIKGLDASIYYSTHSDFSDSTMLVAKDSLVENAVMDTTFGGLNVAVSSGETLYIRAYPWLSSSSTSTSKYFYIGNVVVSGTTMAIPNPSLSTTLDWNFQSDAIGESLLHIGWSQSDIQAVVADDPVNPGQGNNVLKCTVHNYNAAPVLEAVLPAGKTLADYDSLTFDGYFQKGDVAYKYIVVDAYQNKPTGHFLDTDTLGSYNRAKGASTNWEHISIGISNTKTFSDTVYIAFGINCSGTANGDTTTWYADNIMLVAKKTASASLVSKWGLASYHGSGYHLNVSASGDKADLTGTNLNGWESVRGAFTNPLVGNTGTDGAIVVTGKVTFVGEGPDTWSALRYGVYNNLVPGTLTYSGTDSVTWAGMGTASYGYSFMPQSGTDYVGNIPGGFNASQGIALNGSWLSSYGGIGFGGLIQQAPARAVMDTGTYDFAFSFHPLGNGTKRVNFYLQKEGSPVTYWYGGSYIVQDTAAMMRTDTLSSVCFGVEKLPNMTDMILSNVNASLGPDITIPPAPFQAFYVDQWGLYPSSGAANGGWHFVVDPDTLIGNAGIAGSTGPTGGWASIRGGFELPVTATTSKAIIVTGQVTFTGSGPTPWSGLRYGLFRNDSAGTLNYAVTDSATWTGSPSYSYGYMFTPQSGTNYVGNIPGGTNASQGAAMGGNWLSTYGGAIGYGGLIQQAPARATFAAGTYDFAISVQPMPDGSNDVRFYIQTHNKPVTYWYGGEFVDTAHATDTFNGICFGLDDNYTPANGVTTPITAMTLTNVYVNLGAPITVPPAPFGAFYVDQWGLYPSSGAANGGWHFVVDPDTLVGNAGIAGSTGPTGGWASIRGGFELPVTATTSKAIIVTGDVTFVGSGPTPWSGLRYGLFRNDSAGTLNYAVTDSATWTGLPNYSYGYMFTPQSGTNYVGNIPGGTNASQGAATGGNWLSTYGGAIGYGGLIQQAPPRATFAAGRYKFAFSVQPTAKGNDVRFFMIRDSSVVTYWYGGEFIDTAKVTDTFNGICFGLDDNYTAANGVNTPITEMTLTNVYVNMGPSITVPPPPWANYYISDWGFYGKQMGGWQFTPGELTGNATLSGTKALTGWAAIRGGFVGPASARNDKDSALVITGDLHLGGGGFQSPGSLRFGLFNSDSAGTVILDTSSATLPDSTRWSGTNKNNYGYLIVPQSGSNSPVMWSGNTPGTLGGIINGVWDSTNIGYSLGTADASPSGAVGDSGMYHFEISIGPAGNGENDVRFMLKNNNGSYEIEGSATDSHNPLASTMFNSIIFALGPGNTTTRMDLENVQVTLAAPPTITGVKEPTNGELPTSYSLSQNYPNPFNPSTTIKFAIPHSGNVSLVVYDILGRKVTTLVNGELNAGYHSINFNADNLASGVYFYRLKAGNFVNVKKLMLLK